MFHQSCLRNGYKTGAEKGTNYLTFSHTRSSILEHGKENILKEVLVVLRFLKRFKVLIISPSMA